MSGRRGANKHGQRRLLNVSQAATYRILPTGTLLDSSIAIKLALGLGRHFTCTFCSDGVSFLLARRRVMAAWA